MSHLTEVQRYEIQAYLKVEKNGTTQPPYSPDFYIFNVHEKTYGKMQ